MKILISLFLFIFLGKNAMARMPAHLTFSIGSVSSSFTESESKLEATDGTKTTKVAPYSGAASSMPLDVGFEYFPLMKRSYFVRAGGPIMGSTPDRYIYSTIGANFYFNQIGSMTTLSDSKIEIKIEPKFRYYAGPQIGMGYLVYNTKSQTNNDVIIEAGGQAGAFYSINERWSLRGQLEFTRGIGALISSTTIKILFGTAYNLNID